MTTRRTTSPAATGRRYLVWWILLLCLGLLYCAVQPLKRHFAEETARLNREIQARQAARKTPVAAASDDTPLPRTETGAVPQSAQEQLRLAQTSFAAGQLEVAAQQAEALVQAHPDATEAWVLLGDVQRQANRFDAALTSYRKALTREPRNPQALSGLGFVYIAVGWPQEAIDLLEPALRAMPEQTLLKLPMALTRLQQNQFADAERLLLEIHRQTPDDVALWSPLLRLYNDTKRYRETLTLAEEALAKTSGAQQALILYDKGVAQYRLNDFSGALLTFQQAVALRPENAFAHYYLGLCLERAQQLPEAAKELETALQLDPDHLQARLVLGQLYLRMHRTAEGQKMVAEFHQRDARSRQHARIAQRMVTHPGSAEAHWQMALLHQQEHNLPLLRVELQKTLELDSHHAQARQLLARMQPASP